jgi:Cu/Zn superoxide dismutase
MHRQWTMVLALVFGLALAIGGDARADAQGQPVTLTLAGQNNSGIAGTATLTDLGGGKTRVELKVTGAGTGPEPAHIHEGTCANLNPAPKFTLSSLTNGVSSTDIDAPMSALTAGPHAVHLHKSPDELPIYVACADIRVAAAPGAGTTGQPVVLPNSGEADAVGSLGLMALLAGLALVGGGLVVLRTQRVRAR